MPILGITSLCPWEKNASFLTGSLCGVEDKHRCLFHNDTYGRKKIKKPYKKIADMVLPVSPKVDIGYQCLIVFVLPMHNCPMLNVNDVVPRVRRINRTNQLTLASKVYILF